MIVSVDRDDVLGSTDVEINGSLARVLLKKRCSGATARGQL